jgi:hypothetical protein
MKISTPIDLAHFSIEEKICLWAVVGVVLVAIMYILSLV